MTTQCPSRPRHRPFLPVTREAAWAQLEARRARAAGQPIPAEAVRVTGTREPGRPFIRVVEALQAPVTPQSLREVGRDLARASPSLVGSLKAWLATHRPHASWGLLIRFQEITERDEKLGRRERWAELLEEAAGAVREGEDDRMLELTDEARRGVLVLRVADR